VLLPDEKAIVYSNASNASVQQTLGVISIGDWKRTDFDVPLSAPLGVVDGQLVYVSPKGDLMAVPFDVSAQRPAGDPVQMDEGLLVDGQNGAKASLSSSGTIVVLRGRTEYQMGMVSPGSDSVRFISTEPASYLTPRFSPDGKQIAVTLYGAQSTDIWVYDISRNIFTRVTSQAIDFLPEWSPDGRDLVFMSSQAGRTIIYRQHADGSAPPQLMFEPKFEPFETMISPDNKWLIVRTAPTAKYPRDILGFPLSGDRVEGNPEPTPFVTGPDAEIMPRISPNGRWMAYASNEKGHFEVYVRPFPGNGARIQVTEGGGALEPVWGRDGTSLYYREPGHLVRVKVTTGDTFSIGERKIVLDDPYLRYPTHANYDVAPDGRFLVLKRSGPEAKTVIVHNWAALLRTKSAGH
jgi:Tol biopolymer transport system component